MYVLIQQRQDLARRVFEASHLTGRFLLRSGKISDEYFDKYLFEADPVLLREIAEAMLPLIPEDTSALAGLEMGGIPLATILSQITGLPTLFVRKMAKAYGTCKLAEGGDPGRKLVIVEDVVTSGGQIQASAKALRDEGAMITRVICVIDRQQGGVQNLAEDGLQLRALFTMTELTSVSKKE
jgi:orotate phosphoribosyltransferase